MLKQRSPLAVTGILAIVIATAIALSACSASPTMGGMDHSGSPAPSATAGNTGAFNDADVVFATGMVPHHTQAVGMVDTILAKSGIDQKVIDIAKRIKAAQDPEISQMTGWLTTWGKPKESMSGMSGMHDGMMSDGDMAALNTATGTAASTLFLKQMTAHHEGAVAMARTEISAGKNADALALANTIVIGQTGEIAEMAGILSTLK